MKSRLGIAATVTLSTFVIGMCGGALIVGGVFILEHLAIRLLIDIGLIPASTTDANPWALAVSGALLAAILVPLVVAVVRRGLAFENCVRLADAADAGKDNGDPPAGATPSGPASPV